MGCETPEVPHPHSSHCEQDLPQREVGFLHSVNEDTDAVHGSYMQKKHIPVLSSYKPEHNLDCLPEMQTNMHHTMESTTYSHNRNDMTVNFNAAM